MTDLPQQHPQNEIGVDLEKLWNIIRRNILWILLIIFSANLIAYLVIRWTKPLYESESILRLDIQEDTNIFGLTTLSESQENVMAGEIELISSELFLNRVIDAIDLSTSYYVAGNVLNDEKFTSSTILADYEVLAPTIHDTRIYVEIIDANTFKASLGNESGLTDSPEYSWDQLVKWPQISFRLYLTKYYDPESPDNIHFFIINSRQALVDYLQDNLLVEPDKEIAKTVRVAFRDKNASKAQTLVHTIDSLYLIYTEQKKNKENEQKITWLNSELGKIEKQLEDYENYIERFTVENRTSDLNEDLKNTLIVMNELDSQRYELTVKINRINDLQENLEGGQSNRIMDIETMQFPSYLQDNLTELDELQKRKERLQLSYRESTLAIQQLDENLRNASEIVNNQLSTLKSRFQTDLEKVESTKARLEREFVALPGKSNEFNKNRRFYELYEEFYLSLMQSKAEFEIARAGTNTNFEILSPATLPTQPISPQQLLIHGIGAVAGIILSFCLIGILYLLDNKVSTITELEKLTTTAVLGSVPKTTIKMDISRMIVDTQPKSAVSEALRTIRTNIQFIQRDEHPLISVTSTISGEGKTFISVNLGGIIALTNKRVVLLDLDMRKPRVHLSFGHENDEKGISTILINKFDYKECIRKTNLESLDYIPAGPTPPNPSELILSNTFSELLVQLKQDYDMVILDTPPIGLVTDGILVMKKADIALYIVRSNYSAKKFIDTLNRISKEPHLHTKLAAVLNAVPRTGAYGYGYGYYNEQVVSRTKKNV